MVVSDISFHPAAGRDYPRNWNQFLEWFPDNESCLTYLERLRWPEDFVCPACGVQDEPYRASRRRLICRRCSHQSSVTSGTIFEGTRTPLTTWFAAVWHLINQKHGVSALGLKRVLGFGSYQTAWTMLHKLRRAMVRPGRDRLSGNVEVDETYVGGKEKGVRGRKTLKKAIVVIAAEVHSPKGIGRVRMKQVPDVSANSLTPFVCNAVEPGSVVLTDGWRGYNDLPKHGYTRIKTVLSETGDPAHVAMPVVHRVSSLLKRWLLGIHQGSVLPIHLDDYLDEYTFRFNRRSSRSRWLLFYRLLENAVVIKPTPYRSIIGGRT